jgi:PAS domain S-box-containing protein
MQPIGSARFSWRSQKGEDLSADLHQAARSTASSEREEESGEADEEEAQPPTVAAPPMTNADANGSISPALVDQMPAMLWAIDSDLRFKSCRGGALGELGLAPDGLVGMTLFDFFQTEDTTFLPIAANMRALRGETVNYELDWGNRIYRVKVGPERDGPDQIVGTVAVVFDISDVRAEEDELLDEDQFLRRIAESMPDAVVLVDGEGRFMYASPSCESQLGYTLEQLEGVNFLTLIEPEDLAIAQDAIVDVYRGDSYPFAVRMKRGDGSWSMMETVGAAVTTGDGSRLLLVSMRDVSDEKRSEEYVHHNVRMAELRHKAQETAETLRQLLVAIERGETPSRAETARAQTFTSFEEPPLLGESS